MNNNGCGGCLMLPVVLLWVALAGVLFIPVVVISALVFAGWAVYAYMLQLAKSMGVVRGGVVKDIQPPPEQHTDDGREPAFTHYLYRPALGDLRYSARQARPQPSLGTQ